MRITADRSALCIAMLFFGSLASTSAWAQAQPFSHIVIIVQENRTPDNLFGSTGGSLQCNGQDDFEPGVDIQNWGKNKQVSGGQICFAAHPLGPDPEDPGHYHSSFETMYDGGQMDNACGGNTSCYAYVQSSDVQPYFQIATTYSFANYFFQTNEGPSFEAHQFLFSGTSAPNGAPSQNNFYNWFAVDNPPSPIFTNNTGCSSNDPDKMGYINGIKNDGSTATGSQTDQWYIPPGFIYSYPCYEHNTLADLLSANGISWKYYAPEEGSIWSAPTAISHFCGTLNARHKCSNFQPGGQYASNVIFESPNNTAPIFGDIAACNLAPVSWVIPDMKWSDHPGSKGNDGSGPDYVGSLVNAIGNSTCTNTPGDGKTYWNSTAIFIVWDDWGGWYDHVNPNTPPGPGVHPDCGTWGCGYTYGFRVPLLVVSPYTGIANQNGTYSGYVSGNTVTQGGEVFPYVHDFGSILAFIEHNFGIQIGTINNPKNNYPFADGFAPDEANANIPLSDFFGLNVARPFTPIITNTTAHPVTYFTNNPAGPEGPGDNGDPD
jgi:phospholipase C